MQHIICFLKFVPVTVIFLCIGCDTPPRVFPQRMNITETVYASGKIVSADEYRLSSSGTGTVSKKLINDGDSVRKGQIIYVISNDAIGDRYAAALKNYEAVSSNLSNTSPVLRDLRLALRNAILQCSNDSSVYARYQNLWAENIGTQNNLDNMRLRYEASANLVKSAEEKYTSTWNDLLVSRSNAWSVVTGIRKEMDDHIIRSDRDGIVYQTFKEAGETVSMNEPVALIGASFKQMIRMAVDQQDIGKVRLGQRVLIQADVTGKQIFEAQVSAIFPVMNEQDQTFRVDAAFQRGDIPRFIHNSIEANIIVRQKDHALVMPRNALQTGDSVWIVADGKTQKIKVTKGISTLEYIEIINGLDEKSAVLQNGENKKK